MRSRRLTALPGAFRYPAFRRVWATGVLIALAAWTERLAVGWLILTETDSVFLTAASFAARQAPGLVAAPLAGAISDRMPRNRLLAIAAAYRALLLALLAIFALAGLEPLWVAVRADRAGRRRALVRDSVHPGAGDRLRTAPRRDERGRAAVGRRPRDGSLGGLIGGVVIAAYGIPPPCSPARSSP